MSISQQNNQSEPIHFSSVEKGLSVLYGAFSLLLFLISVVVMMVALYNGLNFGFGRLSGWSRIVVNSLLIVQFPLLHSLLLSRTGRAIFSACIKRSSVAKFYEVATRISSSGAEDTFEASSSKLPPGRLRAHLQPTTYVVVASIQILIVFLLWSPSRIVFWEARGFIWILHVACFLVAWVALGRSMWDGHLGIQTGYIGWLSVWRDLPKVPWPDLPIKGMFRICRQPIYFSFMLTLWSGPVWTADKVCVGLIWSAYCYWGPRLKEQRLSQRFGKQFDDYCSRVPYWPRFKGS